MVSNQLVSDSTDLRFNWFESNLIWESVGLRIIWFGIQWLQTQLISISVGLKFNWFESPLIWGSNDFKFNQLLSDSTGLRLQWFGNRLIWDSLDLKIPQFETQLIWGSNQIQLMWFLTNLKFQWFGAQLIWHLTDFTDVTFKWSEVQLIWGSLDSDSIDLRLSWVGFRLASNLIDFDCQRFCTLTTRVPATHLQRVETPALATRNAVWTSKELQRRPCFNDFAFRTISRYSVVQILWGSTSETAAKLPCFNDFDFWIALSPQCGLNTAGLNFKKKALNTPASTNLTSKSLSIATAWSKFWRHLGQPILCTRSF